MKLLKKVLCFIVAFSFINISYAAKDEMQIIDSSKDKQESKQKSDIKNGDELVITEDPDKDELSEEDIKELKDQLNSKTKEMQDSITEVDSEKVEPDNIAGRRNPPETDKNNNENEDSKTDPKSNQVVDNDKKDQKNNQDQKKDSNATPSRDGGKVTSKNNTGTVKKGSNKKNNNKTNRNDKTKKSNKKQIPKANTSQASSDTDAYRKAVDLANDAILSKKLSRKDARKIEESTRSIVEEYNKKIEEATSQQQKNKLARQASDKINKTVESTSKEVYESTKEGLEPSIYDQKDDVLVLEVDAPEDEDTEEERKITSLSKAAKLKSEKENTSYSYVTIVIVIILVISISLALAHTLKKREKNKYNLWYLSLLKQKKEASGLLVAFIILVVQTYLCLLHKLGKPNLLEVGQILFLLRYRYQHLLQQDHKCIHMLYIRISY